MFRKCRVAFQAAMFRKCRVAFQAAMFGKCRVVPRHAGLPFLKMPAERNCLKSRQSVMIVAQPLTLILSLNAGA